MQFENSFDVPLPPAEAWKVLLDVPRIAPCLPGAELTETLGPDKYKGRAGVKIGPVNLFFAGEAEILEKDEAARKAKLKGRGNDTKGRGQASATVDFNLVEHNGGTRVNVLTDLNMTGMVAQYGRASGLMKEIAGAILTQFADNLRKEIERSSPPATAPAQADAAAPVAAQATAQSTDAPAASASPAPASAPQAAPRPAAPAAAPVSAFAILWIALKSWIGGMFGKKSS
jgi:carbon monoxide dehydrogenase subunit G